MRPGRRGIAATAAVIGMLSLATPAVAASTPPPSDPGSATAPLLDTTAYRVVALGESQIRVGILAVARIPHGTAVYYAVAPNSTGDADVVFMQTKSLNDPFPVQALANLAIVDVAHDAVYQPLISGEHCLCSSAGDLSGTDANGTPSVGYAVLPALPADLSSVTIRMGGYAFLPGIPVGDAPPTGPVAAAPVPLGSWPELPDEAAIAAGDVKQATRPLTTNIADPVAATSTSRTRTTVALASDVLFANDSATLNGKAQSALRAVADKINAHGTGVVMIDGYTDSVDSDAHNQALSEARAQSVRTALTPLVTNTDVTFQTAGHGEQDPVADNGTAQGRQLNRRVTVAFATEGDK